MDGGAWLRLLLALTLALSRSGVRTDEDGEEECATPDGDRGRCVCPSHCPSLSRLRDYQHLRKYICGFRNRRPLFCCPPSNNVSSALTRPPILPSHCGENNKTISRIVGGRKSELGKWPWMAAIYFTRRGLSGGTHCGGSLISNSHVLTAAHCLIDDYKRRISPSDLTVRLGEHKLNDDQDGAHPVDFLLKKVVMHPDYNSRTFRNDIAILFLDGTARFGNHIQPICLPYGELRADNMTDRNAFVAGWGTIESRGKYSNDLREIQIPVWDNQDCQGRFGRIDITREYLCAGVEEGGKDACQGDSGGPLMTPVDNPRSIFFRFYQIGIVSSGKGCALRGYPGLYTRLTEYLDWIADNLS